MNKREPINGRPSPIPQPPSPLWSECLEAALQGDYSQGPVWLPGRAAEGGAVRFRIWAPRMPAPHLVLLDDPRSSLEHGRLIAMAQQRDGYSTVTVDGVSPGTWYGFIPAAPKSGEEKVYPDPASRAQPMGVHALSRLEEPAPFCWSDAHWEGIPHHQMVIYELHCGTFSPDGTLEGLIPLLPYLHHELGVNTIEIMPVAQFSGSRNWGYDGVCPYAVQHDYGGARSLERLVDACHRMGIAVILDVVYNHLGPDGNYLASFGPYFTDRYHTPWGEAFNYDGAQSDQVRRYVIENALYWLKEFHLDGLRLDAVHSIFDFGASHILEEIAAAAHGLAREVGRPISIIAESDLNNPRLVQAQHQGGYALDAVWNDDFHHAVHALLTGERSGYYQDFGGADGLARALQRGFVIDGGYSSFRGRRHGAPSTDIPPDRLLVFIQNHDQVGNRATGERLVTLTGEMKGKLAATLLLTSPYIPLLFMGEEYGEDNPFLYFTSFDDEGLAEAVRRGRREEFSQVADAQEVPDPQEVSTFERSCPVVEKRHGRRGAPIFRLYRDLLRLRRQFPQVLGAAARRDQWTEENLSPFFTRGDASVPSGESEGATRHGLSVFRTESLREDEILIVHRLAAEGDTRQHMVLVFNLGDSPHALSNRELLPPPFPADARPTFQVLLDTSAPPYCTHPDAPDVAASGDIPGREPPPLPSPTVDGQPGEDPQVTTAPPDTITIKPGSQADQPTIAVPPWGALILKI